MRHAILLAAGLLTGILARTQGTSCSTAIPLNLNGVVNTYPTSSAMALSLVCTNFTLLTPVTWFSFTTNASAECPLLNISVADNSSCEIAFFSFCAATITTYIVNNSSMCFEDGNGLWAPNENYVLQPNRTYYLRVKTASATSISIGGQFYAPANNLCSGALPVTTSMISDNNSCNKPSGEVAPAQLCAFSIENTAFYKFQVASAGQAIINISNISCDNGNGNNSNGLQIGFFTGNCSGLTPINCSNGSGSFVQATTDPLPAGAMVYVAIDGVSGSNCRYSITGINVTGVLSGLFKYFSGWKAGSGNELKWTSLHDSSGIYAIERAADGVHFSVIGQVVNPSQQTGETEYRFQDRHPFANSYYRIRKQGSGAPQFSRIIRITRDPAALFDARVLGTAGMQLHLQVQSAKEGPGSYFIYNLQGQLTAQGKFPILAGTTDLRRQLSLPRGKYVVLLTNGSEQVALPYMQL